jgi:hypothetical protein
MRGPRKIRRSVAGAFVALASAGGGVIASLALAPATSAFADSQPYELYCPQTPVGNIVLNNVTTSGTITPASPASGQQFNLTNWQTKVTITPTLAAAANAIQPNIQGSAQATIDVTGATPASIQGPVIPFNTPITNPSQGVGLLLPATPGTVGPFTASGGAITVTQDKSAILKLVVGGATLNLNCTAYPNNANTPSNGILTGNPAGTPTSPQVATATAGGGGGTTATTAAPVTSSNSTPTTAATTSGTGSTPATTAMTGTGPHLWLLALIGLALILVGMASFLVGADRRGPLGRILSVAGPYRATRARSEIGLAKSTFSHVLRELTKPLSFAGIRIRGTGARDSSWQMPFNASQVETDLWIDGVSPDRTARRSSAPSGLWIDGWEPDVRD